MKDYHGTTELILLSLLLVVVFMLGAAVSLYVFGPSHPTGQIGMTAEDRNYSAPTPEPQRTQELNQDYLRGYEDGKVVGRAEMRNEINQDRFEQIRRLANMTPDEHSVATGTYSIDGYDIHIVSNKTDLPLHDHPNWVGYTYSTAYGNDIWIESGQSVRDAYFTCVHERLHLAHPRADHDEIRDRMRIPDETCMRLLWKMP